MSEKTFMLCIKAIARAVTIALLGTILLAILKRPIPNTLTYVVFQGISFLIAALLSCFTVFAGKRSVPDTRSCDINEHDSDEFQKRQ